MLPASICLPGLIPYCSVDISIMIPTLTQTNEMKISGDGSLVINGSLKSFPGTSLVVHWLRMCLSMQGMWFQSLAGERRFRMP